MLRFSLLPVTISTRVVAFGPVTQAAAGDCTAMYRHVGLAKTALVDTEAYEDESNRDAARISAQVARHELDVASRVGSAAACLPRAQFLGWMAAQVEANYYNLLFGDVSDTEAYFHRAKLLDDFQARIATSVRGMSNVNPQAYRTIMQYSKLTDVLYRALSKARVKAGYSSSSSTL